MMHGAIYISCIFYLLRASGFEFLTEKMGFSVKH
jgi:hypothetical protein